MFVFSAAGTAPCRVHLAVCSHRLSPTHGKRAHYFGLLLLVRICPLHPPHRNSYSTSQPLVVLALWLPLHRASLLGLAVSQPVIHVALPTACRHFKLPTHTPTSPYTYLSSSLHLTHTHTCPYTYPTGPNTYPYISLHIPLHLTHTPTHTLQIPLQLPAHTPTSPYTYPYSLPTGAPISPSERLCKRI